MVLELPESLYFRRYDDFKGFGRVPVTFGKTRENQSCSLERVNHFSKNEISNSKNEF